MAAVAQYEDPQLEDRRLAEEIERARLEEEAKILAFEQQQAALPPPVWAGSPEVVIDEFNAQPGMVGAPTTIGSEQYMNELARAQRGSGFINADVGPMGNVITPGYDPSRDFAALKAQREATNLQRNQYVDSLVQGGATYAEAYRAGQGRYPQARNDAMRLKVEQLAQRQNTSLMQPEVVTINGVRALRTGPRSFSRIPEPTMVKGVVPPNVKTEQSRLFKEADRFKALLDRGTEEIWSEADGGKMIRTPLSARRKLELQQAIDASELKARDLVAPGGRLRPEFNPAIDQVGFEQMRQAWENPVSSRAPIPAPTAATPTEQVVVTKDGRRYSLPKSQLEEALKAGYRQGQ